MSIQELFLTAIRSLKANKRRSFLTMIGIIIGIASVITIIALGDGVKHDTLKNLQADQSGGQKTSISFMTMDEQVQNGFTNDDLLLIRGRDDLPIVDVAFKSNDMQSMTGAQEERAIIQIGQQDSQMQSVALVESAQQVSGIVAGRTLSEQELTLADHVAVIGEQFAKSQFGTVNRAVHQNLHINGVSYEIVGVVGEQAWLQVAVPNATYQQYPSPKSTNEIELTFEAGADVAKATNKVVELLKASGANRGKGEYSYFDMGELTKGIGAVINGLTYFISAIAGISLFIAGIGVMNMMYISVSERINEIGIRLAVGATRQNIAWQFLIEASLLTVIGGLIGFGLGAGLATLIAMFLPISALITWQAFVLAFGVSTAVGLIFGIAPAQKAAKSDLIDILR